MSAVNLCLAACFGLLQPAARLTAPPQTLPSRSSVPVCTLTPPPPAAATDAALPAGFCQLHHAGAEKHRFAQQQQQQQQQSPAFVPAAWANAAAQGALTLFATFAVLAGDVRAAHAENELATLAASKSTSELVNPQCFANQCKSQMESCAADSDCMKGLLCTAKCMGDSQCTVGCFARYNDAALEKVLQCTIEDAGCIAIATQAPGGDALADAPLPPRALVKATPASMSGRWYKVLGFNPNYDCFECQRNSFAPASSGAASTVSRTTSDAIGSQVMAKEAVADIGEGTAAVTVEYAMPRTRIGQPTETFYTTLNEKLEFDAPNARRTAHTEGRMFGLTFWENWYVIGQNQQREPEFRFVYYTGKTLQNRYEGAFVYARKPELPAQAMPSIYKIAREAGLDPQKACCIDNSCFAQPVDAVATPPLFTPVAQAGVMSGDLADPYGASAERRAVAPASDGGPLGALARPLRQTVRDITELLEDPKPYGVDLFARQRPMTEVREYDINGMRSAGPVAR